jgi:hypothetical protein
MERETNVGVGIASHLRPLLEFKSDVTSQNGEDGMIAEILKRIGIANKWCAEFGASNGTHDSNSYNLLANEGWSGVLIEADKTYFEKLAELYKDNTHAHCFNEFVSFEGEHSLDSIFGRTPMPQDPDLLSIDIDGNDYHIWESLKNYAPRLIVIEYNPTIPNDIEFVQPRDMSVFQGSSLLSLVNLGKEKGYELVAVNESNAFFVKRELYPLCKVEDNSIDILHTDHQFETRLFQLYDGTLKIAGFDRLLWHNIPIDEEKLQMLPSSKRIYPANIPQEGFIRELKYRVRKWPVYPLLVRVKRILKG